MATLSVPPSEPRAQTTPPRLTAFGGIFGWGAVFLLLAGILAYVFIAWGGVGHFTDVEATRALERQKILKDISDTDYKYLHDAPAYFKKDAGLVRVPIDEAIKLTLADLQKIKPHAAYPIAQSPPQNSAAPTSPDKGAGQDAKTPGKTNDNNPPASAPTATPAPSVAPTPGAQPQPSAPPMETNTSGVVTPTPAPSAAATTSPTPAATASPANAPGSTPTPNPQEPGASPAGTP